MQEYRLIDMCEYWNVECVREWDRSVLPYEHKSVLSSVLWTPLFQKKKNKRQFPLRQERNESCYGDNNGDLILVINQLNAQILVLK